MDMPVEVASTRSAEEARTSILEINPQIAIISDALATEECFSLCETLRKSHHREPFQIILVVHDLEQSLIERALNGLIDDFYVITAPLTALQLRVQAAIRRLHDHVTMTEEREYYRRAARQEEELTSRVLDETLVLRERVESIPQFSRLDPVTGLLREPALLEAVDTEIERAVRSLNTLSGFMVSLDDREPFRRTHGADAMNQLMGQVGRAFRHGLRKYDHPGHFGEGAILVVLPGTDLEVAEQVAGRFSEVLKRIVSQVSRLSGSTTFSTGVAAFNEGDARDRWLDRAEASMIRARSLGGGTVETEVRPANAYEVWKAARRT
jgi:diguanylate cyclase (GGDEF)-like protein